MSECVWSLCALSICTQACKKEYCTDDTSAILTTSQLVVGHFSKVLFFYNAFFFRSYLNSYKSTTVSDVWGYWLLMWSSETARKRVKKKKNANDIVAKCHKVRWSSVSNDLLRFLT